MSNATALVLTFIAAAIAAFLAIGVDGLPQWLEALLTAITAGLAAVGIPAIARRDTITRRRDVRE